MRITVYTLVQPQLHMCDGIMLSELIYSVQRSSLSRLALWQQNECFEQELNTCQLGECWSAIYMHAELHLKREWVFAFKINLGSCLY